MEISQLQDFLNNTSQAQNDTQPPVQLYKIPTHIYFFIYDKNIKYLPLTQTLSSSEGSTTYKFPYTLSNFVLKPSTAHGDLESELYFDENSAFGVLGQLIRVKFSSLNELDYSGTKILELVSELKQRGDLKEISGEGFTYLYKVGDLIDGPIITLTKSNTVFSGNTAPKVAVETLKSDGRDLVEGYYRYLCETYGDEVGFAGLNYLRKGYEQCIEDGFLLKHLFDNFMATLPGNSQIEYKFEKGSTEKLDFEIEIEKFTGASLFKIPGVHENTGNFDWNHPRDFHSKH